MEFKFLENLGRDLRDSVLRLLRDYSEALGLALLLALILRFFVFSAYKVTNVMMEPSLRLGDFVVGYKLPYGFNLPFSDSHVGRARPHRGEVVIFRCPSHSSARCVKRIVGLPGDRIEIKGQRLFVNGRSAKYTKSETLPGAYLTGQAKFVVLNESINQQTYEILISTAERADFGPYIVPPDSFFALSDNRDFSEDSRHWGAVALSSLEAKAVMVWLSIDWQLQPDGDYDSSLRTERILRRVH